MPNEQSCIVCYHCTKFVGKQFHGSQVPPAVVLLLEFKVIDWLPAVLDLCSINGLC